MARDFTDYVVEVHGAGERVVFIDHYRQLKKDPEILAFELRGLTYSLNKDRAFRVKGYMPWKKWHSRHPLRSINELRRKKKVGLIKYQEPAPKPPVYLTVTEDVPDYYTCKLCDTFKTEHANAIKSHITRFHKGAKHDMLTILHTKKVTERILQPIIVEPMHISRMHQPSGAILGPGETHTPVLGPDKRFLLTETITPRVLKATVDNPDFKKVFKSYRFGNVVPITGKWWIWLIVVVVLVFVVMIVTGNFQI